MGMFDYVNHEAPCPECDTPVRGWQTKDMEVPTMDILDPLDCHVFYTHCPSCEAFITYSRKRAQSMADFQVTAEPKGAVMERLLDLE